jgi:histidyl-tRNA synthetase
MSPSKQLYEIIDTNFIQDKFEIEHKNEYNSKIKNVKDCFDTIKPLYKSKQPQKYKTDLELIRGFNFYGSKIP